MLDFCLNKLTNSQLSPKLTLFSVFQDELQALKKWEDQGQIDLFFYDEMGLNLIPSIPYGWQTKGETVEIPSIKSGNISTAGFLSRDNRFTSWVVEGAINTEMRVKILVVQKIGC